MVMEVRQSVFYILNHTDSTETRCRFHVVWTLSGGRGFSVADLSS